MKREAVTTAAFLTPLALLSIISAVWPRKIFSEEENRYLAKKPEFTYSSLQDGSFGDEYETWLSDQFPFRSGFVALKTNADRLLLREDVNGVYFGKDHYYIEKIEEEDLMTRQLSDNIGYLASAAEMFSSIVGQERVKVMLVPSASQIMKDKLPAFAAPADQRKAAGMAQKKIEAQTGEEGIFLDVEKALLKAAKEPIYYRTDHHWTALGAFYGYRLYGQAAGFEPWERERFTEKTVSGNFLGTIQSKLGVALKPESITLFIPNTPVKYKVFYDGMPTAYDTLYNEKALEKKDQYSVFLDGNHGWTKIVNEKAGEEALGKRLLILKDSFAHSFAPFVANHFEEVHMIDLRYFNRMPSEFVKEQKITDVLILYQLPGFAKDGNLFKIVR